MYVLADKYDVPKLGNLAFIRLQETLKDFTPYSKRVQDAADLFSYAFGALEESARDDKMCTMLMQYAGCMFEDLIKCDGFESLIEQFPIFAHGMMKVIAERLD